jgi:hypothetical protein
MNVLGPERMNKEWRVQSQEENPPGGEDVIQEKPEQREEDEKGELFGSTARHQRNRPAQRHS